MTGQLKKGPRRGGGGSKGPPGKIRKGQDLPSKTELITQLSTYLGMMRWRLPDGLVAGCRLKQNGNTRQRVEVRVQNFHGAIAIRTTDLRHVTYGRASSRLEIPQAMALWAL